jgi:uroporphyrinogen decarboxylase
MKPMKKIITNPKPDFSRLRKALLREGEPDRIPFIELFADRPVIEALLEERLPPIDSKDRKDRERAWSKEIEFWYWFGYDYVGASPDLRLFRERLRTDDTAQLSKGQREWVGASIGSIKSRDDFERYPWPNPKDVDYSSLEYMSFNLPEGMSVIARTSGILEWVMWLMGYEAFSYALVDDPELVEDLFRQIGGFFVSIYQHLADMDGVGALWMGDDMGHKTGTLISPEHLRKYVFPWQKRIAEVAHLHGLPFILHSCGNLVEVMDDLIDDVRIDAKHSYEDVIMPVAEAKALYGDRICILGGVDVDFLSRRAEDEVRSYVREIIKKCGPGGGYCLGTGNSVANYIKIENYLAMLDEGLKQGAYPI